LKRERAVLLGSLSMLGETYERGEIGGQPEKKKTTDFQFLHGGAKRDGSRKGYLPGLGLSENGTMRGKGKRERRVLHLRNINPHKRKEEKRYLSIYWTLC